MRPTIKTIADEAGTSKSTVDRALKGQSGVKPELRERILRIAEESGYRTNAAGRALRRQRSPMRIAVVFRWRVFEQQIREGLEAAQSEFHDLGIRLEFYDMHTGEYEEQYRLLRQLAASGVRGVVLKPVLHPRIIEAVNLLEAKGIPVITVSSDLPQSKRFCFIGQNYFQAGRVAGSLMHTALGGRGNVTVFQESAQYHAYTERLKGFQKALELKGGSVAVRQVGCIGEGDPQNYGQALAYFQSAEKTDGVFCTGISYPQIAQAALDSGRAHIALIGCDIFEETIELCRKDAVDFVITQNPFREGYESIKALYQYLLSGDRPPEPTFYTPLNIANKESLENLDPQMRNRI